MVCFLYAHWTECTRCYAIEIVPDHSIVVSIFLLTVFHLECWLVYFLGIIYIILRVPLIRAIIIIMKNSACNLRDCFICVAFSLSQCLNVVWPILEHWQRNITLPDLRKAKHCVKSSVKMMRFPIV